MGAAEFAVEARDALDDTKPRFLLRDAVGTNDRTPLLILAGSALGQLPRDQPRLVVVTQDSTLGRDRGNSWSCLDFDDPQLSRRHARVVRSQSDGSCWVYDLGSTNGTWVDGNRLQLAPRKLEQGSVLMLGNCIFVFRSVTRDELGALRQPPPRPFLPVSTLSPSMSGLLGRLHQLAPTNFDMLLVGETGVGKEVHAEAIHRGSGRSGPFVAINCAAIPENLLESELFGFVRGAHSAADRSKAGLLEQADGGTLFFDEIGEMSQVCQTKLLRFLQNREVLPLGATRSRRLDVRVLAATNRDVGEDGQSSHGLRPDLAARFGPEPFNVPPLRDRAEDIGMLATFFAGGDAVFVPEAYLSLFLHEWPGNVRELEKVVTLARALAGADCAIGVHHLPQRMALPGTTESTPAVVRRRPAAQELVALLSRHNGNVPQLARELGRQRTLVWRWLREHDLNPRDFRAEDSQAELPSQVKLGNKEPCA